MLNSICVDIFAESNHNICGDSHKNGVILTNSIEQTKKLWKLVRLLLECACKQLIQSKGICVRWKDGNMKPMLRGQGRSIERFLCQFWRNKGLLNEGTQDHFPNEYEKVSFVIFNGVEYRVGDHVVTRLDGQELDPLYTLDRRRTWKTKITLLFIHEFMGQHQLFF